MQAISKSHSAMCICSIHRHILSTNVPIFTYFFTPTPRRMWYFHQELSTKAVFLQHQLPTNIWQHREDCSLKHLFKICPWKLIWWHYPDNTTSAFLLIPKFCRLWHWYMLAPDSTLSWSDGDLSGYELHRQADQQYVKIFKSQSPY